MANATNISSPGELLTALYRVAPPEVWENFNLVLNIIKAIGIVFLAYIIFMVIRSILNLRAQRRIKYIHNDMEDVNKKLDKVLKRLDKLEGKGSNKKLGKKKK